MILANYSIAPSRIPGAGKGLFINERIRSGSVIVAPTEVRDAHLLARPELAALPRELQATSIRWFEDYCTIDPAWSDECYINHSFQPNALWHLGFVFALADIDAGSEITIDYRLLLGEGESPDFRDALTGLPIVGFSWRESVNRSAALLQELTGARPGVPALDA